MNESKSKLRHIVLTKRELGIIGVIVFLVHEQFSEEDLDSILGYPTGERNIAICTFKTLCAKAMRLDDDSFGILIEDKFATLIGMIVEQVGNGEGIRKHGFTMSKDDIESIYRKFA